MNFRVVRLLATVATVFMASIYLTGQAELVGQTGPVTPQLPMPSGSLGIGRVSYDWTDAARREVHASDVASRRVMVHVWYPTQPKVPGALAPYIENLSAVREVFPRPALEGLFRPAPYALLEQSGFPATHAVTGAVIAARPARFPVIVFSHGLGMLSAIYTAAIEDLVSHGYVVAALDHTYDAAFTTFPDGRVVTYAREAWRAS